MKNENMGVHKNGMYVDASSNDGYCYGIGMGARW